MLGEFCYWIVNMSITASVTGLIVMAARKIKAVPAQIFRISVDNSVCAHVGAFRHEQPIQPDDADFATDNKNRNDLSARG